MAIDRQRIYHKRDRLRQLRAFCRAARLESFAGAALQLDVSPPAVSTHVRELEHELELRLFDRSGSRVSLTSAGEALYALAEPLVEGMDALPNILIENINGSDSGWFELAATAVAASFVLPSCLKRFRDRHPGIRVRVRNCLFREGIRFVLDEDVEFLLGAKDDYPQESVEYQELLTYAMVLITPLDHPLAGRDTVPLEETVQWPAVVPPTGFYTREIEEAYQTSPRGMRSRVQHRGRGSRMGRNQALRRARLRDRHKFPAFAWGRPIGSRSFHFRIPSRASVSGCSRAATVSSTRLCGDSCGS